MSRQVQNDYLSLKEEKGIVHAVYLTPRINLEIAREIVRERKNFTRNRTYPFLIEGPRLGAIDKAARDFFSSPEGVEGVKSAAFVVGSAFEASLLNFFLKVTRQDMPVRIFANKQKAKEWLRLN